MGEVPASVSINNLPSGALSGGRTTRTLTDVDLAVVTQNLMPRACLGFHERLQGTSRPVVFLEPPFTACIIWDETRKADWSREKDCLL